MANELEDRRQRAREAAYDTSSDSRFEEAIEAAIETATRVQITPEMVGDYRTRLAAALRGGRWITDEKVVRAALEAAGFEVVEP